MKNHFVLDYIDETDFVVLAINSHVKAYMLCWNINNQLHLNFEKLNDHKVSDDLWFARYESNVDDVKYNLIANWSKKGYLVPNQKSINYFLVIDNGNWEQEKVKFMSSLRGVSDVLLVFEYPINSSKYIDRFIFNDKKN